MGATRSKQILNYGCVLIQRSSRQSRIAGEVPSMRQDTVKIFRPLSAQMPKLKNTVNDLGQEMPQCNSSKLSRLRKQNMEDSILCAGVQEVSIMFKNRIFMKVKTHHKCTFILNTQRRLPIYNTHIIKPVGINE